MSFNKKCWILCKLFLTKLWLWGRYIVYFFFQITPIESPTPKRFSNVSTRRGRKVQFEPVAEEVFENNEVAMDITTHETVQDNHGMFIEFRNTKKIVYIVVAIFFMLTWWGNCTKKYKIFKFHFLRTKAGFLWNFFFQFSKNFSHESSWHKKLEQFCNTSNLVWWN